MSYFPCVIIILVSKGLEVGSRLFVWQSGITALGTEVDPEWQPPTTLLVTQSKPLEDCLYRSALCVLSFLLRWHLPVPRNHRELLREVWTRGQVAFNQQSPAPLVTRSANPHGLLGSLQELKNTAGSNTGDKITGSSSIHCCLEIWLHNIVF